MSNLEKDNLVLGEIISDDLAPKVLISSNPKILMQILEELSVICLSRERR